MSGKDVIFVGGCMRTGTSLLQSVLCSTEQTNKVIHECQYLVGHMALFAARYQTFSTFDEAYFGSREALAEFTVGIIASFLSLTRKRYGAPKILVLKTPELTLFFPHLMRMLPEAKFVVSVREPKDTIASMIEVGARQRQRGEQSFFEAYGRNMTQFVAHFRSYYAPLFEHLNGGGAGDKERVLFVSYERLLTDTAKTVAALGKFSGIDLSRFDKSALWRSEVHGADGGAKGQELRAWQTELDGKGLSTESLGRHSEVLTAREIQEIDEQSADVCRVFGYHSPSTLIQSETTGSRAIKARPRKHA